jgi:hypothetical protein
MLGSAITFPQTQRWQVLSRLDQHIVGKEESMNKKTRHKFKAKMPPLTYEEYFHWRFDGQVRLIRELERVLGRKKAFEIVGKASEKFAVKSVKREIAEKGPIKNFEEFREGMKKDEGSPFWTHTLTVKYLEETPKKFATCVTECLWAKTFKELNATDIGYVLSCRPDFAMARAQHPKLRLRRTKTLMQGDSYCNHTWYWKE